MATWDEIKAKRQKSDSAPSSSSSWEEIKKSRTKTPEKVQGPTMNREMAKTPFSDFAPADNKPSAFESAAQAYKSTSRNKKLEVQEKRLEPVAKPVEFKPLINDDERVKGNEQFKNEIDQRKAAANAKPIVSGPKPDFMEYNPKEHGLVQNALQSWIDESVGSAETIKGLLENDNSQKDPLKEARTAPSQMWYTDTGSPITDEQGNPKFDEQGKPITLKLPVRPKTTNEMALERFEQAGNIRTQTIDGKGKLAQYAFDAVKTAPDVLMSGLLAVATGGGSEVAKTGAKMTVKEMAKNVGKKLLLTPDTIPMSAKIFAGTYQDTLAKTGDEGKAIAVALLDAYIEGLIEKGGIQNELRNGAKGFGSLMRGVGGEMLEEAKQDPIAPALQASVGVDIPLFSMNGEGIIDPGRMFDASVPAGIVSAFGGGGAQVIQNIAIQKAVNDLEKAVESGILAEEDVQQVIGQLMGVQNPMQKTVNQPPITEQAPVAEQAAPSTPVQNESASQQKPAVKTPEQQMDEAIKQQQGVVDDLSYRKFYLEENVEAELETEMIKLQELLDSKAKFLADKKTDGEQAQRAYDYEQGNIPLEQIMRESEVKDTPALPTQVVGQSEVKKEESIPPRTESLKTQNKGKSFDDKYQSRIVESDKPVYEMDADEYLSYEMENVSAEMEGHLEDNQSPQYKLNQDLKTIEDKYNKNIEAFRQNIYAQNGMEPPKNGYEYRPINFQQEIDDYQNAQNELMEAEKKETADAYATKIHKAMISDAIDAGRDIPENILGKYPYLKKKYDTMKANQAKKGGTKNDTISSVGGKTDPDIEIRRGLETAGESFPVRSDPDQNMETGRVLGRTDNSIPENAVAQSEAAPSIESKYSSYIKEEQELPDDPQALNAMLAEVEAEQKRVGIKIDLQHFAEKIKKKLSKVYSNTFVKSGMAEQAGFKPEDFEYVPISEEKQLEEANERIDADRQGEIDRLLDAETYDYSDINIGMELLNAELAKPENERDNDLVSKLSQKVREAGTTVGQAVQAFAKYSRTPAEVVHMGEKGFDDVEKSQSRKKKEEMKRDNKELDDGINQTEKEAVKGAADEIMDGKEPDAEDSDESAAKMLADRIQNHIKEKEPKEVDALKDMVDELFKVAQESPIEGQKNPPRNKYDLLKAAIKDRETYRDTWDKAKKIVEEKYKEQPEKLALLNDYFENEPRRMFANKTIDKVIKDALSNNRIKADDFVNADETVRKNLINLIMNESGFTEADRNLLSGYLDMRIKELQKEWALKKHTANSNEQRIKLIGEMISNKFRRPFAFDKVNTALKKAMEDKKIKMSDIAKNYYTSGKVKQKEIVDYIVNMSGLQTQDAELLSNYLYQRIGTLRKQHNEKFIQRLIKDKPKNYNKPDFIKKVMELINTGALQRSDVKDLIRVKYGLPTLEASDIQQIIEKMQKYETLPEGDEKENAYQDALKVIADKLPVTSMEKVIAWRRMAMLFNPRTWVRNIGGNAILNIVSKSSDTLAQLFELALPVEERTKAMGWAADKNLVDAANKSWEEHKNEVMAGSRWEILNASDLQALKPIFKHDAMNKLNDFSFRVLEAQDAYFAKAAYINSVGQIMKARGLTEANKDVVEYGIKRAQTMTFRDTSKLAQIINEGKKIPGIGIVLEAELPFVKTPINITKRAIEYSPFGFLKMLADKDATKADITENIAKASTGTAIMAIGMLLSLLSMARTDREKKKNVEDLKKSVGEQANSIITPWGSYTFDWAQPVATPLAMGISIMESIKKSDKGIEKTILDALAVGGDSILNQSVLQNIKAMMGGQYSSTTEAIMSIPLNFFVEQNIPTLSGQIARSVDNTRRSSYGDDELGIEKFARRNAAKIPGASFLLEPEIDIFGNEVKNNSAVEQFLSPGWFAAKNDDTVYNEVLKVYKTAGKDVRGYLPSSLDDGKFSEDKVEYHLTPEEYTEFKKGMGKAFYDKVKVLMEQTYYKNAKDEVKAKMIAEKASSAYNDQKTKYVKSKKPR